MACDCAMPSAPLSCEICCLVGGELLLELADLLLGASASLAFASYSACDGPQPHEGQSGRAGSIAMRFMADEA